jgi:hypothetical protein
MTKADTISVSKLRAAISPPHRLAELQEAVRRAKREFETDRYPWEIPKQWRDSIPGYQILRDAGIRDRLIKALFYGPHRAAFQKHWSSSRKTISAKMAAKRHSKKFPLADNEDWIALYAILNGFDQAQTAQPEPDWQAMRETQALLQSWRTIHKVPSGWAEEQIRYSYMLPISAALTASIEARRGFREKIEQSNTELLSKFEASSRTRIVRWLLAHSPARSLEIAAALGLREDAVRQQVTRLFKEKAWLDYQDLEMTREGRGLYRLQRIEKAGAAEK